MKRPTSIRTARAAATLGEHITSWRKLHGLTADQVCQRAAISRPTLRKIEHGDPTVSFEAVLNVVKALGRLDALVEALDPYETPLGRARADMRLPQRVRS
jgi:transcriptional regulator with XRE-family HTH domain